MAELTLSSKRSDRESAARALYDEIAARYPNSARVPEALLNKAALEERAKLRTFHATLQTSVPAALVSYRTVATDYPHSASAESALDRLAAARISAGTSRRAGIRRPPPAVPIQSARRCMESREFTRTS